MLLNTRGSTLGKERARLSEDKGEKRECKTFSKKNSRKTVSLSTICDDYCSFIGGKEHKKKKTFSPPHLHSFLKLLCRVPRDH